MTVHKSPKTGIESYLSRKDNLTQIQFDQLSKLIYQECGIKMPITKKVMLESRLQKRLNDLKMSDMKTYCEYLFSNEGRSRELVRMIDVVTTNKTDFFREAQHFEHLRHTVVPEFLQQQNRKLNIWSAACSSGEEPYTIAMVLHDLQGQLGHFNYSIYATDISVQILEKAVLAIYSEERLAGIPHSTKRKFFLRSKDPQQKTYRIVPELRAKVQFDRCNLMDERYETPDMMDIVFCRNVLIYFDRPTQEQVIGKICSRLRKGGYLYIGHSESLTDMELPLKQVMPTVFRRV